MLPFQTENRGPGDFLQSTFSLLIVQTEVCRLFGLLTKKLTEVIRLQRLNGLNGLVHLCLLTPVRHY
jgi:hypothetical protein